MSNNCLALHTSNTVRLQSFYSNYFDVYHCQEIKKPSIDQRCTKLFFENGLILKLYSQASENLRSSRLAISVPTIFQVIKLTYQLIEDGYSVLREPESTDNGHYYSLALDPDGNQIEIYVNSCF